MLVLLQSLALRAQLHIDRTFVPGVRAGVENAVVLQLDHSLLGLIQRLLELLVLLEQACKLLVCVLLFNLLLLLLFELFVQQIIQLVVFFQESLEFLF